MATIETNRRRRLSTSHLLAANVRRLRDDRGWTQTELARRLNRQQSRVSEVERASHPVGSEMIDALAKVFRVPPSDLLADLPDF